MHAINGWRAARRVASAVGALALCALAYAQPREGVQVGQPSVFANMIPAARLERDAALQYQQTLAQAEQNRALGHADHPQVLRLRAIAQRIIPFAQAWNPRAERWNWEVNLIGSQQINAYCMPGGKIVFYTGLLNGLRLNDDEVAMVMGHEIAHALREHARERMAKSAATNGLARIGGALASVWLGVDPHLTDAVARSGAHLATLEFSREDESEADLVGMELAARAGFDPRAGVSLWKKCPPPTKARRRSGCPPILQARHGLRTSRPICPGSCPCISGPNARCRRLGYSPCIGVWCTVAAFFADTKACRLWKPL